MAILTRDIFLRAVIVRLFFFLHCVLCVWRVVEAREAEETSYYYWALLLIPLLLLPECALTLKYSRMGEWETFRPCIFIYLASVVPNIWVLEHKLLEDRLSGVTEVDGMNISVCLTGDSDGDDESGVLFNVNVTNDIQISFPEFDSDTWSLALQQILLFVIIVGRWMLPRGKHLDHGKLSNVLLLQIAMAADILEFLSEGVRTDEVLCEESVIIGALVLWTVSLLQLPFHFDTKAVRRMSDFAHRLSASKSTLQRFANNEVWEILSAVILQDGPFLCMRLFFLFILGIFNQGLIFFIAKNILVLVLQLYRLWALVCVEVDGSGRGSNRLVNMIRATLRGESSPEDHPRDDAERAGTNLHEVKRERNDAGDRNQKPVPDVNHNEGSHAGSRENTGHEFNDLRGHENKGHDSSDL